MNQPTIIEPGDTSRLQTSSTERVDHFLKTSGKKHPYIVFEGPDGSGKTTLAKALCEEIEAEFTYEPMGEGNDFCKTLRSLALDKPYKPYLENSPWSRELIMLANRGVSQHQEVGRLLESGPVVSDRSVVSGYVYAKVASEIDMGLWTEVAATVTRWCPDIIVVCIPSERKINVNENDIYDTESDDFHSKIRREFKKIFDYPNEPGFDPRAFRIAHCPLNVIPFTVDMTKSVDENILTLTGEYSELRRQLRVLGWTDWEM